MKTLWWIIGGLVAIALTTLSTMGSIKVIDLTSSLPKGKGTYKKRKMSALTGIVIHHSASDFCNATDIANWHIKRGWPGIGYHFVIYADGTVNQTNELDTISYHVENKNTPNIGICLVGHLSYHAPTPYQIASLKELITRINTLAGHNLVVRGHRDLQATECPGLLMKLPLK
jgi:N-acetyl-anhydromuramyl-L-alanine amidase AmpD